MAASSVALVFPGQGAEEPGMGLALAAVDARAKRLLALASDATGVDLERAIERGGRALGRTEVLQPALVAVSLGAAHALRARGAPITAVLGHSLGELAAACFALDLDDETAIVLAAERGRRMADAASARPGGMIAVPTLEHAPTDLVLAAHNAPDEHVLSGDDDAIARWIAAHGGTRLRVAGAWHSPAMSAVVAPFRARLEQALTGRSLGTTFVSAVDARSVDVTDVGDVLSRGLIAPVRWVDTLHALSAMGVDRIVVAPPGRLSRSLVHRNLGTRLDVRTIETPGELDAASGRAPPP